MARPEPITDPAELVHLFGRFFLCLVVNVLIAFSLVQRNWVSVAVLSAVSLFVHRTTIVLWKRLSRERQEKLAAREAGHPQEPQRQ